MNEDLPVGFMVINATYNNISVISWRDIFALSQILIIIIIKISISKKKDQSRNFKNGFLPNSIIVSDMKYDVYHAQTLFSFKKYMPSPLPYFKVNICPLPLPHFASIFFAYL